MAYVNYVRFDLALLILFLYFSQFFVYLAKLILFFLDFNKAFDEVLDGKFILKLESIGPPSFIVRWIAGYS